MLRAATATLPPASATTLEGLYATGYWLFMQQRAAHALSVFRALVHLAPHDERGWVALGACYEAQDQPDLALHVYGSAVRVVREAPRCEIARARILRVRGRWREAQRALMAAVQAAGRPMDDELRELVASEWDLLARLPGTPGTAPPAYRARAPPDALEATVAIRR